MKGNGALHSGDRWVCSVTYELTIDREADGSFLPQGFFDVPNHFREEFLTDAKLRLVTGEHVTPRITTVRENGRVNFLICDPVMTGICLRAAETTSAIFTQNDVNGHATDSGSIGGSETLSPLEQVFFAPLEPTKHMPPSSRESSSQSSSRARRSAADDVVARCLDEPSPEQLIL